MTNITLKKIATICLYIFIFSIFFIEHSFAQFPWLQYAAVTITIEGNDSIFYWEYENPTNFKYEENSKVVRGDDAKQSFEHILTFFDLLEDSIHDDVIRNLEKELKISIERVVIKLTDRNLHREVLVWIKS